MSPPIVFASAADDFELMPSPICRDWIVEGTPQARSRRLVQSADGTASLYAWSCTAGRFHWHYAIDETLHIVSGEVFVTDEKGDARRLGPGDTAFFPAGSRILWHVPKEVRKFAVCRHAMPRPLGFLLRVWGKLAGVLPGFSAGTRAPDGLAASATGGSGVATA
jgi:uncharacterized cupin superfamily protein